MPKAYENISETAAFCMQQFKGLDWIRRSSILPPECIEKYFIQGNFADIQCFRSILSRVFGYLIIICSGFIKLPQIITIWGVRSADGVSLLSELLMLCSIFGNLTYGFTHNLPLPAYGDSYFLFLHTAFIILMIVNYSNLKFRRNISLVFLLISTGLCVLLFTNLLPKLIAQFVIDTSMACAAVSRLWQAYVNWRNKSTGQLSSTTTILIILTTFSRIFTSMQDADNYTTITFILICVLNIILLYQLGYYWNYSPKTTSSASNEQFDKKSD
ncbi:hypothetical protein GJ496_007631 [Pomphorhynchus laevis]|nr:hypothetical protein GJ496_007631 [Pomphorhynchus laevis]